MAFAGLGALSAARADPGSLVQHRVARDPVPRRARCRASRSRGRSCSARSFACLVAVVVGLGALRVRGLLLAISTLAFAIAAQAYIFSRPIFTAGQHDRRDATRRDIGPLELTHRNRGVLLLRAVRARRSCWCSSRTSGAPASGARSSACARTRTGGVGDDGVAGAGQAHRLRARRVHRRPGRRAPRRLVDHDRLQPNSFFLRRGLACAWSPSP